MEQTDGRTKTFSYVTIPLLMAVLLFAGFGCRGVSKEVEEASKPFTLKYWRVFDDEDVFRPIIAKYNAMHPNVRVEYRKFRYDEYERELLNAIAEGSGPDIMTLHNTWMGEWQPRLLPVPSVMTVPYIELQGAIKKEKVTVLRQVPGITIRQLANDFVDAVSDDAVLMTEQEDPRAPLVPRIYGLPLFVDTMALCYNKDLLNRAGIPEPAEDWRTFQEHAKIMTKLDEVGTIIESAAAIGTADNVERSSDMLALLMMQNGAQMVSEDGVATFDRYPPELAGRPYPPGAEALIFYTDFANPTKEVYTWNDKMPDSFSAFVSGQTAYFFGYSYHLEQIRLSNPDLNFGIANFPQIEGNAPINSANYWLEVVSDKTEHPDEAWEFIQYITAAAQAQTYLQATKRPTALRGLINSQLEDLDLSVFASQLPNARSWYKGTDAPAIEEAFDEMIRQALADEADPAKIVELGATKVNQTMQ